MKNYCQYAQSWNGYSLFSNVPNLLFLPKPFYLDIFNITKSDQVQDYIFWNLRIWKQFQFLQVNQEARLCALFQVNQEANYKTQTNRDHLFD